jgi:hypothetical protein
VIVCYDVPRSPDDAAAWQQKLEAHRNRQVGNGSDDPSCGLLRPENQNLRIESFTDGLLIDSRNVASRLFNDEP